ncbi:MAG TPA: hypothetical protein PLG60_09320 [Acidimicrobiales bacterium]|nr:hypothetical protein [Acidimicrobiales bacterium]
MTDLEDRAKLLTQGPLGRAVLVDLMGARPDVLARDVGLNLGGQPYSVQKPSSDRAIGASSSKGIEAMNDEQNLHVARSINLLVEEQLPTVKEFLKNSSDVMRRVGETIEHYAYGPAELWQPLREALVLAEGSISRIAEAVAATSDLDWWWGKISAQDQKWMGDPVGTLNLASTPVKPIEPPSDEQRSWWWVSPVRSDLLRTTRGPVGPYPSVASICRSGYESAQRDQLDTWAVQIPESVKVYEVLCAEDWASLVERYPRQCVDGRNSEWTRWTGSEGPWLLPDWDSIARDFDGVHVSLTGYLASAFRALPAGEAQTVLIGWNPDETLWLRSRPVLSDRLEVHILS